MSVEVGSAYISLLPSMRGFAPAVNKSLNKSIPAVGTKAGTSMGSRMASAAGRMLKTGVVVGAATAGAVAGATLLGGFRNAVSRQNSEKVFTGLYGSAKGATAVMKDLRKVASDSPLSYESYLKAGESLAYAGVKGKEATGTLQNVGKAIVAAGGDSTKLDQAMGGVMKAVNNGGIAMMDSLSMISESGVPILSGLSEKFGQPIDQIKKMASEGKINITDVMDVMQNGTGETFQTMIKAGDAASLSFGNQWQIAKDKVINAVGTQMIPVLDKLAPIIGDLGGKIAGWIENADFTPLINGVKGVANWIMQLDLSSWDNFMKSLSTGGGSEAFSSIGKSLQALMPAFREFGTKMKEATPALATLGGGVITMVADGLGFLAANVDKIVAAMPFLLAAFVAWRVATAIQTKLMALQAPIMLLSNAMRMRAALLELRLAASKNVSNASTAAGNAVERVSLLTRLRNVAATVAQRTATIATAVATRAAAAGQWLLNAAMSANPIGLIIAGIAALVAGLVWFFTQTKLGQTIITAVWAGIKTAIGAVYTWFTQTVVPFFQAAITKLVVGFQVFQMRTRYYWTLFKQVLSVVWNWVKTYVFTPIANFVTKTIPNAFKFFVSMIKLYIATWRFVLMTAWKYVKTYVFNPIKNFVTKTIPNAFQAFVNLIKQKMDFWKRVLNLAWSWVRLHVFRPINVFVKQTIPNAFQTFVNLIRNRMNTWKNIIRNVWVWVKEHAFNPITKFVKETIPNAFKRGVDLVGEFWNKLKKTASKPVKFVVDTVYNNGLVKMWNPIADFIGKKKWKLNKVDVSKFATGGRVSGPGTSTSDSIPARLSNNEHVLTAKDVKNLGGHSNVYALRSAAAHGWTPGLATGGTLSDAARWLQSKGARITEFGAWGQHVGRHSNGSLHYSGRAFDANYGPGGQNATEQRFFDSIIGQFHELFPKLRTIWRAPGHYNHFHADTGRGGNVGSGGSGGGGAGAIPGLSNLVDWVKGKIKNIGGEGRVASGMKTMATKLVDGMAAKATSVFDFVGDAVDNVKGGITKGVAWGKGQAWAASRGLSPKELGWMNWIVSKESGWNPKAQNPRSTASGLPQFVNGTARQYLGGAPAKKYGVFKQLDGMNRYVHSSKFDRYGGGWKGAYNYWQKHNYYAKGTLSAARGWATVGEDGPELLKLRGGEQIKSNRKSRRFIQEHTDGNGRVVLNVNFNGRVDDPNEAVNKLQFEVNRLFAGGRYK